MSEKPILIFDFDGTIADTFHYILDLSDWLAGEFRFCRINRAEVEALKDKTLQEIIQYLQVPISKLPFIIASANKRLRQDIRAIDPVPGLSDVLKHLKTAGHQLGIVTSNSSENVRCFLDNHGLDVFDFISSTSRVLSKNISLRRLMKKRNLRCDSVVYIGDETRDIEAARKAGVRMAAVTWGYNSHKALLSLQPDHIVHSPEELLALCQTCTP